MIRHTAVAALTLLLAPLPSAGQEPAQWQDGLNFGTYSIAAIDRETGEIGVAVTSRVPCVGNIVPHVRAGVGAVVTQALARIEYGEELLDRLASGVSPQAALEQVLANDADRATRQIGVIGVNGRAAQHTGRQTVAWAGHRAGTDYIAQGNLLVSSAVLKAVADGFESTRNSGRPLADRLIEALRAGEAHGGDARKAIGQSAAVLVADPRPGRSHRPGNITVDINVCEHPNPVQELERIYESVTETLGFRTLQQFYGADVVQLKLMLHALGYFRPDQPVLRPDVTTPFYDAEVVAAVNAFREHQRMTVLAYGTPPGLVDDETVDRLWAALEQRGLDDDIRRLISELRLHR
jgi:uncharacterized Ntn-hydrolase superfamily protein